MATLTAKKRKSLKPSTFGLPKEKKYPMPDKSHAANAKARATQMVKKGKLSEAEKKKIDAKANKILNKKSECKSECKSKINTDKTVKKAVHPRKYK